MSLRTYDYICKSCKTRTYDIFEKGEQPEILDCEFCGEEGTMVQTIGAPAVLRASYHDGYKRGGDYQLIKEASKLEVQAASARPKEATELRKQATNLKRAATKEKPKDRK